MGGRAKNIAVYATSNRRHLIKETLTDRTGDDIHEADTRQELTKMLKLIRSIDEANES